MGSNASVENHPSLLGLAAQARIVNSHSVDARIRHFGDDGQLGQARLHIEPGLEARGLGGRTMQLDPMQGRGSAICCSRRVVIFYNRSSLIHLADSPRRHGRACPGLSRPSTNCGICSIVLRGYPPRGHGCPVQRSGQRRWALYIGLSNPKYPLPGLVPGIHALATVATAPKEDVDGRVEPGRGDQGLFLSPVSQPGSANRTAVARGRA